MAKNEQALLEAEVSSNLLEEVQKALMMQEMILYGVLQYTIARSQAFQIPEMQWWASGIYTPITHIRKSIADITALREKLRDMGIDGFDLEPKKDEKPDE